MNTETLISNHKKLLKTFKESKYLIEGFKIFSKEELEMELFDLISKKENGENINNNRLKSLKYKVNYFEFLLKKQNEENKKSIEIANKPILNFINLLDFVEEKENFIWSKSPYSNSYYYHDKDTVIEWSVKPEGSLRIADHWNWEQGVHCPVKNAGEKTINELQLAIFKNNYYEFIA